MRPQKQTNLLIGITLILFIFLFISCNEEQISGFKVTNLDQWTAHVKLDGEKVGEVRPYSEHQWEISPGTHHCYLWYVHENIPGCPLIEYFEDTFTVEAGYMMTYKIESGCTQIVNSKELVRSLF